MKRLGGLALGLALALGGAACGGDDSNNHDAGPGSDAGGSDAGSDGGPNTSNLTGYVIDLVQNHTNATEASRAFSEFSTLPDPDGDSNNTAAYAPLFP